MSCSHLMFIHNLLDLLPGEQSEVLEVSLHLLVGRPHKVLVELVA